MIGSRLLHYRVALWSSLFIAVSAVTGLLWAYAPHLYWQEGYKEKKSTLPAPPLKDAALSPVELIAKLQAAGTGYGEVISLTLKADAGRLVYQGATKNPKGKFLVDAQSGDILSPLTSEYALRVARQYVANDPPLAAIKQESNWEDRKHTLYPSVWIASFSDDRKTEIVIDASSGEIIEDSDTVRRFHFWVMTLHQFSFFGTHKTLTAISGIPLLVLLVTGMILAFQRLRLKRRRKAA